MEKNSRVLVSESGMVIVVNEERGFEESAPALGNALESDKGLHWEAFHNVDDDFFRKKWVVFLHQLAFFLHGFGFKKLQISFLRKTN